jgi:hypothetical protein
MNRHLFVVMMLATACTTSADPRQFELAQSPHGVAGTVTVGERRFAVQELLAVQDSGYVVLVGGRVAFGPFRLVNNARFRHLGSIVPVNSEGTPAPGRLQQLRFASRFPHGIPAPAMAALLRQSQQQAVDTLGVTIRR